eukprot:11200507-Lingulodinium_polyedra.AAC.1
MDSIFFTLDQLDATSFTWLNLIQHVSSFFNWVHLLQLYPNWPNWSQSRSSNMLNLLHSASNCFKSFSVDSTYLKLIHHAPPCSTR